MRRAWKIFDASQRAELLIQRISSAKPKTLKPPFSPTSSVTPTIDFRFLQTQPSSSWPNSFNCLIGLFDKSLAKSKEELIRKVLPLRDELVNLNGVPEGVHQVLKEKGLPLFASYSNGSAFVELLTQLYDFPQLAVEVVNWRRQQAGFSYPITAQEYTKGITVAGRAKNIDLAVELFTEAANNHIKTSSTYNALMGVYMTNGLAEKCQSLFRELKSEETCSPTVVTYNILISTFGRLMMIDHMETTLQQIYNSKLCPNVSTFNNLIAGYVTAWMWDRMEDTYRIMQERSIVPDTNTHLLMLRGYSHAGNLKKMEEMYELLKEHGYRDTIPLVRNMICAYSKSSCANKIQKIDALIELIPEQGYRPWLNVLLIRVYAREQLLERMEKFINVAFENHTVVTSVSVMRSIITTYYRLNAVDKLAGFVKLAECAGWRICRSLYHCKMVMYGSQNRLEEMENVIAEMEKFNINSRTKKTLIILYKAYTNWGPRWKLEQVVGLMCKHGYGNPLDECPS